MSETITVQIGSIVAGSGGLVKDNRRVVEFVGKDNRRVVEFVGEELATHNEPGAGRDGGVSDTRGRSETLYRVADGRLVVHVEEWSRWQGEPTTYSLHQVAEDELRALFPFLAEQAGLGRPLTLDEALALDDWEGPPVTAEEMAAYQEGYDEGMEAGRNLVDDGLPRRSLHTGVA